MPYLVVSLIILVIFAIPHLIVPHLDKEVKHNPWYYAMGFVISIFLFLFLFLGIFTNTGGSLFLTSVASGIWLVNAVLNAFMIPVVIYLQKTKEK